MQSPSSLFCDRLHKLVKIKKHQHYGFDPYAGAFGGLFSCQR
jgi:hypothetical protein